MTFAPTVPAKIDLRIDAAVVLGGLDADAFGSDEAAAAAVAAALAAVLGPDFADAAVTVGGARGARRRRRRRRRLEGGAVVRVDYELSATRPLVGRTERSPNVDDDAAGFANATLTAFRALLRRGVVNGTLDAALVRYTTSEVNISSLEMAPRNATTNATNATMVNATVANATNATAVNATAVNTTASNAMAATAAAANAMAENLANAAAVIAAAAASNATAATATAATAAAANATAVHATAFVDGTANATNATAAPIPPTTVSVRWPIFALAFIDANATLEALAASAIAVAVITSPPTTATWAPSPAPSQNPSPAPSRTPTPGPSLTPHPTSARPTTNATNRTMLLDADDKGGGLYDDPVEVLTALGIGGGFGAAFYVALRLWRNKVVYGSIYKVGPDISDSFTRI